MMFTNIAPLAIVVLWARGAGVAAHGRHRQTFDVQQRFIRC
jgi:hypothetical protein